MLVLIHTRYVRTYFLACVSVCCWQMLVLIAGKCWCWHGSCWRVLALRISASGGVDGNVGAACWRLMVLIVAAKSWC